MVEAIGNRVTGLQRTKFGSLSVGRLTKGGARRLSDQEIARLWADTEASAPES